MGVAVCPVTAKNNDWSEQIITPLPAIGLGINIKSVLTNESKEGLLCAPEKDFPHQKEASQRKPFCVHHLPVQHLFYKDLGLRPAANFHPRATAKGITRGFAHSCLRTTNLGTTDHQTFHHVKMIIAFIMKATISGILKWLVLKAFYVTLGSSGSMMAE